MKISENPAKCNPPYNRLTVTQSQHKYAQSQQQQTQSAVQTVGHVLLLFLLLFSLTASTIFHPSAAVTITLH